MSHTITFLSSNIISGASSFADPSSFSREENFPISQKETEQSQAPMDHILHDDALSLIFRFATEDGRNPKTFCAIRAVNRRWYCLLDTHQLKYCWQRLEQEVRHPVLAKSISLIGCSTLDPMIVEQSDCDEAMIIDQSGCDEAMIDDQAECDQPAPGLVPTYFSRFADLTQTLREKGAPIPHTHTVIGFELSYYEDAQQRLDTAFKAIWTCIPKKIRFEEASISTDAEAIRKWLHDPINTDKITLITKLSLLRISLTVLPSEIDAFSRLTELNLSCNMLSILPPTIGNLSQLNALFLSSNQLTSLPDTIGNLSLLKTLIIAENRLTSLPDTIGNLSQLEWFQMNGNRLTNLPLTIGNLSQLTELNLNYNQLATLPDTIGNLSQIKTLNLHGNRFTSPPDIIGKLSSLKKLLLDYNRLVSLSDTISNLSQFEELQLYHNQLTNLPDTIGNLSKLKTLNLADNPLIFILDKNLHGFSEPKKMPFKDVISKLSACSNYACRTPLASLCQQIHRGEEDQTLQTAFEQLSDEMQQHIHKAWTAIPSSSSSSSEARIDLFADRTSFVKAVIIATRSKWQSFSTDQRNQTYVHIAYLAGQPEDEALTWGETHAEENIIRLIDAMELVTQNPSF